jgi:hypothetical protein
MPRHCYCEVCWNDVKKGFLLYYTDEEIDVVHFDCYFETYARINIPEFKIYFAEWENKMKDVHKDFFKHVLTNDPFDLNEDGSLYEIDNFVQYIHPRTGRRRMYYDMRYMNQAWDGSEAYGSEQILIDARFFNF